MRLACPAAAVDGKALSCPSMDSGCDAKLPAEAGPSREKPPRGKSPCPKPPRAEPLRAKPPPPRPRAYVHLIGKATTSAAKPMATGSDNNFCFIVFLPSHGTLTLAA